MKSKNNVIIVPITSEGKVSYIERSGVFIQCFGKVINEYLRNSSIAGFKQLVEPDRHFIERIIWLIVICASIFGVVFVSLQIWGEFVGKPTIVSIESTQYPIWKVPFPGIALCNINKISYKKAFAYAYELALKSNVSVDVLLDDIKYFGRNIDFYPGEEDHLLKLMDFLYTYDVNETTGLFDTFDRMKKLSPSCSEMLIRCRWVGKIQDCGELFQTRRTMEGFCCTFNYRKTADPHEHIHTGDHDVEILTLSATGTSMGLSVVVDPHLEDYFYTLRSSEGFNVLIFNPSDYPDESSGGLEQKVVQPNSVEHLHIDARTIRAVPDIRRYSVEQRGCRFENELSDHYNGHYSHSNCLVQCKLKSMQALCKCKPFFMPVDPVGTFFCTLAQVSCLNKYREKFRIVFNSEEAVEGLEEEHENALTCLDCFPDCSSTSYSIHSTRSPIYKPTDDSHFLTGINLTDKSILHVFYGEIDTDLYKMDVLFYWFEIVSYLGGICGLFVGFSLISVVEFIYYFTLRFYAILRDNDYRFFGRF